jgi:hypothetical protein
MITSFTSKSYVIPSNTLTARQYASQNLHRVGKYKTLNLPTSVFSLADHGTLYCAIRWQE